jgi:hypothetical protein
MVMVLIILAQFGVFAVAPAPATASAWFARFQESPLLGLLSFELLMIVYVILSLPLSLAIFAALGRSAWSLTAIYLALTVVGTVAWIMARPALEMLHLSELHAVATDDVQRAALVASGEQLVATFHGTAFHVSYFLGSIAGLILSVAMLRSQVFSKTTAGLRIASSVLDFGLFLPAIGLYVSLGSVLALLAWDILVARRLLQLARE